MKRVPVMSRIKRIRALSAALLSLCILLGSTPVFGAGLPGSSGGNTVQLLSAAAEDTAACIYKTAAKPQVGSVGGDWAVMGLARSEYKIPREYYEGYYERVAAYIKARQGVLHEKKYTEYSRLITALTAMGQDPSNMAGYNLLTPLGDFDQTIWQGINGPIWALIALDSGNYPMPKNPEAKTQATRQMYVDEILRRQLSDGGFSLTGGRADGDGQNAVSDPDITGMALQALAKYQDQPEVKRVTEEALGCLSDMQNENGGFASWGTETSESCAQVIVALSELGIPFNDQRFIKNGKTPADNLLTYYKKGQGFRHTPAGDVNQMATEQAFYAIVAAIRAEEGKNSLYRMSDAGPMSMGAAEVALAPEEKTFSDITGHKSQQAIEALAGQGIINGKTGSLFMPDATMTRAEFAAIVVKALGLNPEAGAAFADVPSGAWYEAFVNTASRNGIITGTSASVFQPGGTITRQEAAVMVARAAKIFDKMDWEAQPEETILNQFKDAASVDQWAKTAVAFCCQEKILSWDGAEIRPKAEMKRGEIAEMLYRMLTAAGKLSAGEQI